MKFCIFVFFSSEIEVRESQEERRLAARISYTLVRLCWRQRRGVHGEEALRYVGAPARVSPPPSERRSTALEHLVRSFLPAHVFPAEHLRAKAFRIALRTGAKGAINRPKVMDHFPACLNWEIPAGIHPVSIGGAPSGWSQDVLPKARGRSHLGDPACLVYFARAPSKSSSVREADASCSLYQRPNFVVAM